MKICVTPSDLQIMSEIMSGHFPRVHNGTPGTGPWQAGRGCGAGFSCVSLVLE